MVEFSLDTVVASALLHEVSKLAEFDGRTRHEIGDLLSYPQDGVYLVFGADLPVELAHMLLSHTDRTTVEPATLEAALVRRADEVAAAAVRSRATDDLQRV